MKTLTVVIFISCFYTANATAQTGKTELYVLIEKLLYDSTGYENVGDWAVAKPKKYPIAWKADKIEMSDDPSINFYRTGTANLTINGKSFSQADQPVKWNIMLKGPRMGYSSFSIISSASKNLKPKWTIDSMMADKPLKATLLKTCVQPVSGFYYYEVKLPKKDIAYMKFSWITINGNTALRVDGYDNWSKANAKLACPTK